MVIFNFDLDIWSGELGGHACVDATPEYSIRKQDKLIPQDIIENWYHLGIFLIKLKHTD